MVYCKDCGRKLKALEAYKHPTMGKKHHLCSKCYDNVSSSVENWKRFVVSNSFTNQDSIYSFSVDWKDLYQRITTLKKRKVVKNEKSLKGYY